MLVVPELNHELRVFHEKRHLFNALEEFDTSISELLRSLDMASNERPDSIKKIKGKIQVCALTRSISREIFSSIFTPGIHA